MKCYVYILGILLALSGCGKITEEDFSDSVASSGIQQPVPEGYFVVSFQDILPKTKAAVNGSDARVQHLRYLVYKSTGEYVKSRVILLPGNTPVWPLTTIRDTLKKGAYKAVFLANAEKTLFPDAGAHEIELLQNYTTTYANARIYLPNDEFQSNTEYYWAKVDFSDINPTPPVLLQRIISMMNLHRNFVDAKEALDTLVSNIVTQVGYKNILRTAVQGLLPGVVKDALGGILLPPLIVLDDVVNLIVNALVEPVTNALYDLLLEKLVDQIGTALQANENQDGLLGVLGELLNPWEFSQAHTAIVDIRDFPKSIDFDLKVQEKYYGTHQFRYDFTTDEFFAQKCLHIKNFSGLFNIEKINVIKEGLVSGLVLDGLVDNSLLLNGAFIDINDSLVYTPATNRRYKADYSFLDLGLKSYTQQTDGNHALSLTLRLGDIANLDDILQNLPIVGTILNLVLAPIENIQITVSPNLPLLGVENLKLEGGWSTPVAY